LLVLQSTFHVCLIYRRNVYQSVRLSVRHTLQPYQKGANKTYEIFTDRHRCAAYPGRVSRGINFERP